MNEPKKPLNGFFVFVYYLVTLVANILHPVTVIGRENLPEHGAMLCPNHNSNWDPVLVALKVPVNYRLHIMAKKELFCNKVFDWVLRKLGAFPVDRGEGDIEAVKNALKAIKSCLLYTSWTTRPWTSGCCGTLISTPTTTSATPWTTCCPRS